MARSSQPAVDQRGFDATDLRLLEAAIGHFARDTAGVGNGAVFRRFESKERRFAAALRHGRNGFTIIELLVVITIIVVLITLLTPGLDRAVYRAELLRCAGRLRVIGQGVQTYAADHRRAYPARATVINRTERRPFKVYESYAAPLGISDDRLLIRPYVQLKALIDPFCKTIDISPENTPSDPHVYGSYDLWYGFYYDGYEGMTKLGNRLRWADESLNLLGDCAENIAGGYIQAAHPDDRGWLAASYVQHDPVLYVYSLWIAGYGPNFGKMDRNTAYADGSVTGLDGLWVDTTTASPKWDERMTRVPGRGGGPDGENLWNYVAK